MTQNLYYVFLVTAPVSSTRPYCLDVCFSEVSLIHDSVKSGSLKVRKADDRVTLRAVARDEDEGAYTVYIECRNALGTFLDGQKLHFGHLTVVQSGAIISVGGCYPSFPGMQDYN